MKVEKLVETTVVATVGKLAAMKAVKTAVMRVGEMVERRAA